MQAADSRRVHAGNANMKPFMRRTLGLLPIVGAGAGLTTIVIALANQPITAIMVLLYCLFAAVYLVGMLAGLWILEDHPHGVALSLAWWTLQIPQLLSKPLSFYFWSCFNLGAWWNFTQQKPGLSYQVGSSFLLQVFNRSDFVVAVNVWALVLSVYLYLVYRRQYPTTSEHVPTVVPQPAAHVE